MRALDWLVAMLMAYGLYIVLALGATTIHVIPATAVAFEYGLAAGQYQNMIDPNTNQPIGQELVSAFGNDLPVDSDTISYTTAPTIGEAGPNQLLLFSVPDDAILELNIVPENGFVHLTVDYGLVLPIKIPTWSGGAWTTVEPSVTPFHFSMAFFQEWQS